MDPFELLAVVAGILDEHGIAYVVTGSVACLMYGDPRFTNDVDIAVQVTYAAARQLCEALEAESYDVSVEAALEAVRYESQFNLVDSSSGLKVDFMIAPDNAFNASRFSRRRRLEYLPSQIAWFASPEDVILRKLSYFREGESEKHIRDIRGILRVQADAIEMDYIESWVERLELQAQWSRVISTGA